MTQIEAFSQALELAITAPTDEQADRAVALAEQIAEGLTADEIDAAKRCVAWYAADCPPSMP